MQTECYIIRERMVQPKDSFMIWLRSTRKAKGWTMEALADATEITQPFVSGLERGIRNPSRDMVTRLAAALSGPDADEHMANALLNAGLRAAGFAGTDDYGPIETLLYEKGYSSDDLSEEGHERLRQSLDAVIVGIVEQERQKRRLQ